MSGYVVGIDIGGTTTAVGLVDREGRLLAEETIPTRPEEPADRLVDRLHERIGTLINSVPSPSGPAGIGVGAPNANYYRGTVEHAVNLHWGTSVNLVELFRRYFDLPVVITNDANAAALGEQLFGAARAMRHFVVITLGTGLGSGIVVNGELVYGADGFAGELGHTIVEPAGRLCGCGNRGCLETYVSATGICRTVLSLLAERRDDSPLRRISPAELTSKEVYDAARDGDGIALAAYDETARILGMKLADTVAHLSPEAIIFTGGFAASGDLLFVPVKRYLDAFLLGVYRGKVAILPSGLPAGAGGVLGAAALVWHELDCSGSGRD